MSRIAAIRDALEQTGWSVHPVEPASDCWWAKEIWELRSLYAPRDLTTFLVLLVDPMFEGDWNRIPESAIWAVGITRHLPRKRAEAETDAIAIRRKFKSKVEEIPTLANGLRTSA